MSEQDHRRAKEAKHPAISATATPTKANNHHFIKAPLSWRPRRPVSPASDLISKQQPV
jgi:hypothetical protein